MHIIHKPSESEGRLNGQIEGGKLVHRGGYIHAATPHCRGLSNLEEREQLA